MDARTSHKVDGKIDTERFGLRTYLESLRGTEELEIVEEPVDLADVAARLALSEKAVWFKNAGGSELVGNVVGSRARLASAFGVPPRELALELERRLALAPEIVEIPSADAPVHQVVLSGDEIDVTALPVHLQHAMDGAPFISASIDYSIDPATGQTNAGLRRLMLRGRKETGVDLNAPSDLRAIYMAAQARGERLPVSFVVGCHPVDCVSATMKVPRDELGLVASLRAAPMAVVKCVTNDIRVPADAEYVIEGYLDERGYVEKEGPYGEYLGYYGGVKQNPVFHVTAITRRANAIFQTATISGNRMDLTDTSNLEALRSELSVWAALRTCIREPVAVYAPVAAGGSMSVRIAMRQRFSGEARTALYSVLGTCNIKNVFVMDPDIDVFSDRQVEWALGTRFQPDKDFIVASGVRLSPLDPSLHGAAVGAKAGYDLTWPMQHAQRWELQTPTPPSYAGKRFDSLRAALEDGPKRFEELMAATGSRDGREIVRALDDMGAGRLVRDEMGRYALATH